jgi:ABC-2 type transport system permease protein
MSTAVATPRLAGSPIARLRAVWFVYKWELLKLRAQKRTYLGLGAAMLAPTAFVLALVFKSGGPSDIPLGRYLRESGLATPFVVLEFMAIWGLPLIAALVAGDIVASESQHGTLKTVLTRSRERGEIFAGKLLATLTYTATALALMAGIGLAAATAAWGWKPLVSLSGPRVSANHSFVLLLATLGIYLFALLGIAAFGVLISTITRNSAAAVVSTLMFALLMQLLGALPGTEAIRPYLLSNQFVAWHGLLRVPVDWAPIGHAAWLSALYIAVPVFAAYLVFLRRDVAGE